MKITVFTCTFFLWTNCCWVFFFITFILIGFEFSEYEPSALVQRQGGPCAVIAPVQAFLLKTVLSETSSEHFSNVSVYLCMLCFVLKRIEMHCLHSILRFISFANVCEI